MILSISNLTINTLNNNSSCNPGGYTHFPATGTTTTNLFPGSSYTLLVTIGPQAYGQSIVVYFDWNQDGLFKIADGEYYYIAGNATPNSTQTISVTVPTTAAIGPTRMRVRNSFFIYYTDATADAYSCNSGGIFGETEDYTINILVPCVQPVNPVGSINTVSAICGSTTVAYSGTNAANAFWQTSPTGTDTTFPATSNKVVLISPSSE